MPRAEILVSDFVCCLLCIVAVPVYACVCVLCVCGYSAFKLNYKNAVELQKTSKQTERTACINNTNTQFSLNAKEEHEQKGNSKRRKKKAKSTTKTERVAAISG